MTQVIYKLQAKEANPLIVSLSARALNFCACALNQKVKQPVQPVWTISLESYSCSRCNMRTFLAYQNPKLNIIVALAHF